MTNGTITATLSGTAAELDGLAESNNAYTITVTDTATLAQLVSIDAATSIALTYAGITGTELDFFTEEDGAILTTAAQDYVTGNHPVSVTGGNLTVAQANALAIATDGVLTASITGSAATLVGLQTAATDAISITVTGSATLAQLATLDDKTSADVAVTSIVDSVANLFTGNTLSASAAQYINGSVTVQVTGGTLNATQTAALVAKTNGVVTANVTDSAANLATLLPAGDALAVTVNTPATVAQAAAIDAATTGSITFTQGLTGTAQDLYNDARLNNGTGKYVTGDVNVTVLDDPENVTVLQLNTINQATDGNAIASISGTAAQLVGLVASDNSYTIAITDTPTAAQLLIIQAATALPVTVTINGTALADTLDYSIITTGLTIDGKEGDDVITGGAGDDILNGGAGSDVIVGGAGKDTLNGGADADTF